MAKRFKAFITWDSSEKPFSVLKIDVQSKDGTKYLMQYRWRCTFRDAYHVCCLLWPFAHTKLPKIQQVIEHYSTVGRENVVNIDQYRHVHKNT